jgi:hypothetical protein
MTFFSGFLPQPDTFEFYQLQGGCHFLAQWLTALGRGVFPDLVWKTLKGPRHSLACGTDKDGNIRILFDILQFQRMSAQQILKFASLPPRRRPVKRRFPRRRHVFAVNLKPYEFADAAFPGGNSRTSDAEERVNDDQVRSQPMQGKTHPGQFDWNVAGCGRSFVLSLIVL